MDHDASKLDPTVVRGEFDRRAQEREGINTVLSDRFNASINERFNGDALNRLARHCPGPFHKVLEIGVGVGRLASYFCEKSERYVGIDFSDRMLAKAHARLRGKENIDLLLGDASAFNFPEKSFDLGVISLVLKHNSDERAAAIIEKIKHWCVRVLLIEHVAGGATGSDISIIRPAEWYIERFKPLTPIIEERFLRNKDCILLAIFQQP